MFGSVDKVDEIIGILNARKASFKLHVDAAFGGFIYPFTCTTNSFTFRNPYISSFTVDAHKLLQAPYGTGIFLARKDLMHYACTEEARYIPGKDYTLCGSRSGANAVAVWMILHTYGSEGWKAKMENLVSRTTDLCQQLDRLGIEYFRNPLINIIAIKSKYIDPSVAGKYMLVADDYERGAKWWKIVMMPHVKKGTLDRFINELQRVSV
jgi:glutamate/tyrosine decarboxylase-like PLP-dependent enzyme